MKDKFKAYPDTCIPLTKEQEFSLVNHDPLLAEVNFLARAYGEHNPLLLNQSIAYARLNEQTALLEAVAGDSFSLTEQQFSDGRFVAYNQPITEILAKGLSKSQIEAEGDPRMVAEVERRAYELEEQRFLDLAAETGVLDSHYMVVVSPYPSQMDQGLAKDLGYVPKDQVGKVRVHSFQPNLGLKTTASLSYTSSNLRTPQIDALLREKVVIDQGQIHQVFPGSDLLGTYFLLPKGNSSDWETVLTTIEPAAYSGKDNVVAKSKRTMEQAAPLVEQLVNLDQELALSVVSGFPTKYIREVIGDYLNSDLKTELLDSMDRELLKTGRVYFTLETARVLKKIGLTNSYLQVAVMSDQEAVKGAEFDHLRYSLGKDLNIFGNNELDYALMMMSAPLEIAFCGYGFEGGSSVYGYSPDIIRGFVFDSVYGDELRKTTCPTCKHDWLLKGKHGVHGIKCSCGSKVEGGKAAQCIVESSKKATTYDVLLLDVVDVCD